MFGHDVVELNMEMDMVIDMDRRECNYPRDKLIPPSHPQEIQLTKGMHRSLYLNLHTYLTHILNKLYM